jgi:hypothetical protein
MVGVSVQHAAVLDKLVECRQDLSRRGINSRAIVLAVPPGGGQIDLLDQFVAVIEDAEAISVVVRVPRGARSRPPIPGRSPATVMPVLWQGRSRGRPVCEVPPTQVPGGVRSAGVTYKTFIRGVVLHSLAGR